MMPVILHGANFPPTALPDEWWNVGAIDDNTYVYAAPFPQRYWPSATETVTTMPIDQSAVITAMQKTIEAQQETIRALAETIKVLATRDR